MVISFLVLWSICLNSSLLHFKNSPKYFTRVHSPVFITFTRFLQYSFISSSFLVLLRYFLNVSFHLYLFDGVSFQYSKVFVRFLFTECSNFFLGLVFRFLFPVSFLDFHYWHGSFFYAKFHPYVLTVHSHSLS